MLRFLLTAFFMLSPTHDTHAKDSGIHIQDVTSEKGVTAWLIQDDHLPIVSIQFAIEGGSAFDPQGKKGLTSLTMDMLREGAGDLPSKAFQEALEEHNISLSFWTSKDRIGGSMKMLKKDMEKGLELLTLATTQPRFDADAIERLKKERLASIRLRREDPATVAHEQWQRVAFPNHPYGTPSIGEEEDIARLTRNDIRSFFTEAFNQETLLISVAGDITQEELAPILDGLFAHWTPHAVRRLADLPEATLPAPTLHVVERPIPQTVVAFGKKGMPRHHPDYYAYYLLNYILGGGSFSARLMDEIREKRGLAYSVYTSLWDSHAIPLLRGALATSNEHVQTSLDILKAETQRIANEPITQEELDGAKTYVIHSLYLNLVRTSSLARFALNLQMTGIGKDYPQKREQLFHAVTREDIQRVARSILHDDAWLITAVGQPVLRQ
ncbi:MAG: insulinase family protein [Alphaproteobacteria bacterium GM7ARS4]|nr:insulinase family protein [Alphaproteobacteria bacterium GM7ARS4]